MLCPGRKVVTHEVANKRMWKARATLTNESDLGERYPCPTAGSMGKIRLYWAAQVAAKVTCREVSVGRSSPTRLLLCALVWMTGVYRIWLEQPVLHFETCVLKKTSLLMICRRCQGRLPCDPLWTPEIFWNVHFLPYIWVPLSSVEQQVAPPKQPFPQFWTLQLQEGWMGWWCLTLHPSLWALEPVFLMVEHSR